VAANYIEVLARDWKVTLDYIYDSNGSQVTKEIPIPYLESIGFDVTAKEADVTTFDDSGNESNIIVSRARTLRLQGLYKEDMVGKTPEPGMAALIALSEATGVQATGGFTVTSPAGVTRIFEANASMDSLGGSKDDPTKWACTLKLKGGVTYGTESGS
jgi:hypothetical protein